MVYWARKNWFLLGLVLAAALGFAFPEAGASGGILRTEKTTLLGVAAIFFIRGTLLPMAELRRGLLAWRLHLAAHGFIFAVLPLATVLLLEIVETVRPLEPDIRIGFVFMAALPTTISTGAVFTSLAGGNTAGAVFNATVSNCLGVVVAPLWVAWMLQREGVSLAVGPAMLQIVLLVIAPLVAGQIAKPFLGEFSARTKRRLENVSSGIVLFVLFAAFANSVEAGVWREHGGGTLAGAFLLAGAVFGTATGLAFGAGKWLRFQRADRICLFFVGPQKTLAGGVTVAQAMFADSPGLTLILLPVLFYHFIQLFAGGFAVERMKKNFKF